MNKKKICLVLPTLTGGGMERVISELANYFSSIGHEIHIICLVPNEPFYKINEDIKIHQPPFPIGTRRGVKYWLKILFFLRNLILGINPNTVLSIPQGYSNLTILALFFSNIPVYVSDRNSPNMPVHFRDRTLRKMFYPYAKGIIAQTDCAKKKLEESGIGNNNIMVIPNPLKKMNYHTASKDSNIILNVGRLVMEKNQLELIEIFASINNPNWRLHIIGDGPLKEILLRKIESLKMTDKIQIFDAEKEIDKIYSKAEIFAFTSIYEGFPNALNEAMSAPLACIAYDCVAGPSEMIKDGVNGYLVSFKDKIEYREKLSTLMNDSSKRSRFKVEAQKNRELFSIESMANKYLNFILEN